MKKWMDNFTLEQRYYLVSDSVYMSVVEPLGISVEMPFMCHWGKKTFWNLLNFLPTTAINVLNQVHKAYFDT
jgi:hypothetical protein